MTQESVVYGCIKDTADSDIEQRHRVNEQAIAALPAAESWAMINQEMFAVRAAQSESLDEASLQTQVTHFGASYQGVEYEWKHWLEQFEGLLRQMYWVSASVHLETELSGTHSFIWHTDKGEHQPGMNDIQIRCEWVQDI